MTAPGKALRWRWHSPDPDRVHLMFETLGAKRVTVDRYWLPPLWLEVTADRAERGDHLTEVDDADGWRRVGRLPWDGARPRTIGIGRATVDLQRSLVNEPPTDTVEVDEPLLGARGVRLSVDPALVMLEPITEGRLAAALARHGEGPVALYLEVARSPGVETLPPRITALGRPGRLVRQHRAWGPFLILLDAL